MVAAAWRSHRWLVRPSRLHLTITERALVAKPKTFPLRNEAPLYCAALRSRLDYAGAEAASRVCDERQKTAPLTPLPPRTGDVSLDNANVVIDGMTIVGEFVRRG